MRQENQIYFDQFISPAILFTNLSNKNCIPSTWVGYEVVYWLARHKDAHAWVEAWDDELQQWVLVEATPASGVPGGGGTRSWLGYLWDYINFRFQELRVAVHLDGLKGLAVWLWHRVVGLVVALVSTLPGLAVLTMLVIFIVYRRLRHRRRATLARPCSKTVLAMHELRSRVDAKLAKLIWKI